MKLPRLPHTPILSDIAAYWSRERLTLRQGLTALGISTTVGIVAGLVLASMEGLLEEFGGLFILVPAAIGMRGAIFGTLAARFGTGMLTGQFTTDRRRDSFTVQNLEASALLTLSSSALAALAARATAGIFGIETISLWKLMVVSMVGGILASLFIMAGVLLLSFTAQRRNWDMDAIGSPIVTTTGDIVTLPALVVGTLLIRNDTFAAVAGGVFLAISLAAVYQGLRSSLPITRRIVQESLPVLTYAVVVDILAGTVLEVRIETFVVNPALLILIPPFIATAGSLGGILSARLGSDLHLGLIQPHVLPEKLARLEGSIIVLFSLAAFTGVGVAAEVVALLLGFASPGLLTMVGITLVGGLLAVGLLFAVGYSAATATYHFGLDPDNHGIPIVTATMDFLGVLCLVAAIALWGVR